MRFIFQHGLPCSPYTSINDAVLTSHWSMSSTADMTSSYELANINIIKTENQSKIQSLIEFKEMANTIPIYLTIHPHTFSNDFLFMHIVCHFRYTFPILIWVDKSISSYVMIPPTTKIILMFCCVCCLLFQIHLPHINMNFQIYHLSCYETQTNCRNIPVEHLNQTVLNIQNVLISSNVF